jgi:aspartyl-tRNA(Asn)/glutamyl-tRNA(Gln) amidotransferase subunit B
MTTHSYEPVIGLEIHVQLSTRTKMFCSCDLSFGDPPNTHTCPVCLGLPGSLPVVNERAIHLGLMIGLALGSELAPRSIFHRKNYFYPDLPKGYQISQYDLPLCRGGQLGEVRIHRVHLEEDAAKLTHIGESGRIHGSDQSVVDFNRGGTPLAEIVTEPDLRSAEDASDWLKLLRTTLRQLGVSDVNMEEGSLRCDANISLRPVGEATYGTKTELKNMNSFSYIKHGIEAEIERQRQILDAGEEVEQETLHFDPKTARITSLRSKEEAHDYRYFPEPDLVPIAISAEMVEAARAEIPELPVQRAERFEAEGIATETAWVLASRVEVGDYYEAARDATRNGEPASRDRAPASLDGEPKGDVEPAVLANWVRNELLQRIDDEDLPTAKVTPEALARLVGLVAGKKVTQNAGKQVLDRLVAEGGDPEAIVEAEGLAAIGGGDELEPIVDAALQANTDAADKIRAGNMKAIGAIIGHVMRETKGRADGAEVTRIVREKLGV